MQIVDAPSFLKLAQDVPVIDIRSPGEFRQGHIPGAFSLSLFDDKERQKVGTLYQKSGKEASVLLGLDIVGPKMSGFVKQAGRLASKKECLIHCWRGGMRSSGMAWLLETAGFDITILQGGYKAYRNYIRQNIARGSKFVVLGGKTGSGKSEILRSLKEQGEQILDLEMMACHKGSAFGHLGQTEQPTNEQFENDIYAKLHHLNPGKPVWIEDESRSIGLVSLCDPFILKMKASPLIFVDVDKELRIKRLVREYSDFDPGLLESAVHRISQRLGGQNAQLILEAIRIKDFEEAAGMLLNYYDKQYLGGLKSRVSENIYPVKLDTDDPEKNARAVCKLYYQVVMQNHLLKTEGAY